MVNRRAEPSIYEKAKTSVWWDIDNMPIPKGCKAEEVAQKISSALRKLNYSGQISIFAYGNMNHIPPSVKQALSSTGVHLEHVHSSFERGDEGKIYNGVLNWTYDGSPPPANLMFISRDKNFSYKEEWERGFNILIAHPPNPSDALVALATTTWLWKSLLEEPEITCSQNVHSHRKIATMMTKKAEASFNI